MVGVDTIRWGASITAVRGIKDLRSFRCDRHVDPDTGEVINYTEVKAMPGGPRLWVEQSRHGNLAKVEVSVPRYRHGTNVEGSTVGEALEAMADIHRQAQEYVTWAEPFEEQRLYRVDGLVDFVGVGEPEVLLRAMGRDPSVTTRSNLLRDDTLAGAWTLERYTTNYLVRLYDKCGEVGARARRARNPEVKAQAKLDLPVAAGRLRCEAQMKSGHLPTVGMATVRDLSIGPLEEAVRHLFTHVGFGREVVDMERVITKLHQAGYTPCKQAGFLGWLTAESAGAHLGLNKNTLTEYRRIARKLNIAPTDLGATFSSRRLDFDSGAVVSEAA